MTAALLIGCGGIAETGETGGGDGDGALAAGGHPGAGGHAGAGGSGVAGGCCAAAPTCNFGDTELARPSDCASGATCYQVDACCSTVTCQQSATPCAGPPWCDQYDFSISGCPELEPRSMTEPYACYSREACDVVIHCAHPLPSLVPPPGPGASCNPMAEHWKRYVALPAACSGIVLECGVFTTRFDDACGCGCEQDSTCPAVIDCTPDVGEPTPVCANAGAFKCPLSTVIP